MATIEDARAILPDLERAYEVVVRGRWKFRVGQIVFVAFSTDETLMGFGFPKEERAGLVEGEPHKFLLPGQSDMRFNWVVGRLAELDVDELRELVVDAWRMCVPKKLSVAYDRMHGLSPAPPDSLG